MASPARAAFLCPLDRAARSDKADFLGLSTLGSFYALLIGLLVATRAMIKDYAWDRECFYALLIGLLVATDPATDGP